MATHYTRYYLTQSGGGLSDIGSLYHTPLIHQRGRGSVGDFFSAVIRHLKPLFISGLNAVKEQSLKAGTAILSDLGKKPINQILQEQANIAAHELAQKGINKISRMQSGRGAIKRLAENNLMQFGSKIKRVKRYRKKQKVKKVPQKGGKRPQRKKRVNRRKKKRVLDIFT